jgi:hypothetical protein
MEDPLRLHQIRRLMRGDRGFESAHLCAPHSYLSQHSAVVDEDVAAGETAENVAPTAVDRVLTTDAHTPLGNPGSGHRPRLPHQSRRGTQRALAYTPAIPQHLRLHFFVLVLVLVLGSDRERGDSPPRTPTRSRSRKQFSVKTMVRQTVRRYPFN